MTTHADKIRFLSGIWQTIRRGWWAVLTLAGHDWWRWNWKCLVYCLWHTKLTLLTINCHPSILQQSFFPPIFRQVAPGFLSLWWASKHADICIFDAESQIKFCLSSLTFQVLCLFKISLNLVRWIVEETLTPHILHHADFLCLWKHWILHMKEHFQHICPAVQNVCKT